MKAEFKDVCGTNAPRVCSLRDEIEKSLLFKSQIWEAWLFFLFFFFLFFYEELETLAFQDGLGMLPYLGGELLLICQAKQMWRRDNIYFHNSKQIWWAAFPFSAACSSRKLSSPAAPQGYL